jgi:hypothetical protein
LTKLMNYDAVGRSKQRSAVRAHMPEMHTFAIGNDRQQTQT